MGVGGDSSVVGEVPAQPPAIAPWQQPLFDLNERLKKAGPGAQLKWAISRKREGWIVVDSEGRVVE